MNKLVIVTITFTLLFFLMIQIRFLRRFIRLKKSYDNLPGALFLAEAIGYGCCMCLECCASSSTSINFGGSDSETRYDIHSGKPPEEYEIKVALEDSKKTDRGSLSAEEEQTKVKDLVSKRQKTSIMYVSNRTSIPQERIIEIILDDPDFMIEHEYVVNKKLLMKEEIAKRICSICKTPFEPSHEFCANCGNILK
ncbi:MAG: hypothetical protein ACTSR6_08840 [Candidatus Heimdallarchaeota archaeon]